MIREYKESDYNAVNVLGREINPDYFIKFNSVSKCFVYEENEEVVGFILIDMFSDRAEIIDVAVEVMHRNNKIGDKLVKYVIDLCKNNDFRVVSIRKKYYSTGTIDANLMQRKL